MQRRALSHVNFQCVLTLNNRCGLSQTAKLLEIHSSTVRKLLEGWKVNHSTARLVEGRLADLREKLPFLREVCPPEPQHREIHEGPIRLTKGQALARQDLCYWLGDIGYDRSERDHMMQPGTYCLRGDALELLLPGREAPILRVLFIGSSLQHSEQVAEMYLVSDPFRNVLGTLTEWKIPVRKQALATGRQTADEVLAEVRSWVNPTLQ